MENNLGIFFIMFQSQLNSYVKCWIDGSDFYELIFLDDFMTLVKKVNNTVVYSFISNAIETSSIYLWDITNNIVKRLSPTGKDEFVTDMLVKAKETYRRHQESGIVDPLSGISYNEKNGLVGMYRN